MTSLGFLNNQYGPCAARTARDVVIHLAMPCSLRDDLTASFTAKKTAPAGILLKSGAVMPRYDPLNSSGRLVMEYFVFGI